MQSPGGLNYPRNDSITLSAVNDWLKWRYAEKYCNHCGSYFQPILHSNLWLLSIISLSETGWEECLQNHLLCCEYEMLNFNSVNQTVNYLTHYAVYGTKYNVISHKYLVKFSQANAQIQ